MQFFDWNTWQLFGKLGRFGGEGGKPGCISAMMLMLCSTDALESARINNGEVVHHAEQVMAS